MTNSTDSFFFDLTNNQQASLSDLIFVAQYISPSELEVNNFKDKINNIRIKSDQILQQYPHLQFLEPLLYNYDGVKKDSKFINANNLTLSQVKFDGTTLSLHFEDESDFKKTLQFQAKNLVVTTRSYSLNDENQFENDYFNVEENEHINDIVEDFYNIFDIYFSEHDGIHTAHIFFLDSEFEPDMNGHADLVEVSFDFISIA